MRAYRPELDCPLCHGRFEDEERLATHLGDDHAKAELVKFVITSLEDREEQDLAF